MAGTRFSLVVIVGLAGLNTGLPGQDMIQLTDGRFVTGPPMTRTPDGVQVHFKNGEVLVRKDLVRDASVSKTQGMPEDKPPPDAAEKEAQGFVRFEGKWLKKEQRDKLLDDRQKARARRIKDAMEHREWRSRYKTPSANFDFEYTIDPEALKDFSALMEEYYKKFLAEWKIVKPSNLGKLKVCFYHDEETYYQVSGATHGMIGYFKTYPRPVELNFFFDRDDLALTLHVMFHETNHYLIHLIDPEFSYPIWINESLAEYYGASQWDPVKKQISGVGSLQEGRLASIQSDILNGKMQDLNELIHLPQSEFGADKYAWGWSFVHYILENKKYAQKFKTFYMGLAKDKSVKTKKEGPFRTVEPDEVIRYLLQNLGVKDLKTLETEWHDYVKGLRAVSGHGYADAGRLYRMQGQPIKARRFFETAIEKGDTRPIVYYGLGKVLDDKQEYEAAENAFKKAIEGDPLNGTYYAALGRALELKTKDPKNAETQRLRMLALEVDPDNSELLRQLSRDEAEAEALKKLFDAPKGTPESKPAQ